MAATRRLGKELNDIKASAKPLLHSIRIKDNNVLQWEGVLKPQHAPYSEGAFKIDLTFPTEYPFKPPTLTFSTPIYHPNVDEKGQVCLPIINAANWKPATKTDQVIQALMALINDPEPEHPLRSDLAKDFVEDKDKFMKNAREHTAKHAHKNKLEAEDE